MKKRWGILLTVAVVALVVYLLLGIDFVEVYSILKTIQPFYFLLAFLSCFLSFLVWNLRWKNSLRPVVKGKFRYLFVVLFAGIFMNTITPGTGIGGEPIRAYYLKKKYKKPQSKFFGAILADKTLNLSVFFLFLIFSLIYILAILKIPFNTKVILQGVLIILILALIIFALARFRSAKLFQKFLFSFGAIKNRFADSQTLHKYLNTKLGNVKTTFKKNFLHKRRLLLGILLSVGVWLFTYLTSYFVFLALNFQISFFSVIAVVSVGYFVGDVSPIPGGIGLMESSMFLLYSSMGIPSALAIAVVLLSRIIYYFYAIFIGSLSLIYLRLK